MRHCKERLDLICFSENNCVRMDNDDPISEGAHDHLARVCANMLERERATSKGLRARD